LKRFQNVKESSSAPKPERRRRFTHEFKEKAVQMLPDCHPENSVASPLALKGSQGLYR